MEKVQQSETSRLLSFPRLSYVQRQGKMKGLSRKPCTGAPPTKAQQPRDFSPSHFCGCLETIFSPSTLSNIIIIHNRRPTQLNITIYKVAFSD